MARRNTPGPVLVVLHKVVGIVRSIAGLPNLTASRTHRSKTASYLPDHLFSDVLGDTERRAREENRRRQRRGGRTS